MNASRKSTATDGRLHVSHKASLIPLFAACDPSACDLLLVSLHCDHYLARRPGMRYDARHHIVHKCGELSVPMIS